MSFKIESIINRINVVSNLGINFEHDLSFKINHPNRIIPPIYKSGQHY